MTILLRSLILLAFGILGLTACASPLSMPEAEKIPSSSSVSTKPPMILAVLDVGQGDATLLITPAGETILIDAGPPGQGKESILPFLKEINEEHVDAFIASHYDSDHIGGLSEVMDGPDQQAGTEDDLLPSLIYDRGGEKAYSEPVYEDYKKKSAPFRQTLEAGQELDFGAGLHIRCLVANGLAADGRRLALDPEDENGHSLGLLIEYGSFRYFTAGDLTGGGVSGNQSVSNGEDLVAPLVGSVDVLHVDHHGSETSTSPLFLQYLQPTVSLISTGNGNRYGHPDSEVLARLERTGTDVYLTEQGNGGLLPSARIADGSLVLIVQEDGSYTVNGSAYKAQGRK